MSPFVLAVLLSASPRPAVNTKCPVLGNPTDASSMIVVVKNQQYRICCYGCGPQLAGNPDKFLLPDGTPRNAH
jgi:hypothetical protein